MKHLVIGPGGIFFYMILGHVYRLYSNGHLKNLTEISSASAGSLVAFFWSMAGPDHIDKLLDIQFSFKTNPLLLVSKFGLVDSLSVRKKLESIVYDILNIHDITFKEHFEKTRIVLHISAFSLTKRQTEYFSVHNTPNMSMLDAITMSCCVPFYFSPFNGYVDGGLTEAIPWTPFINKDDVYAIMIDKTYPAKTKTFFQFVNLIASVYMNHRFDPMIPTSTLNPGDSINPVSFNISKTERLRLFSKGYFTRDVCKGKTLSESQSGPDPTPTQEHHIDPSHH